MKSKTLILLAVLAASALAAAENISLDGEWRLDYFPQPDNGAVREVAAVPSNAKTVKATMSPTASGSHFEKWPTDERPSSVCRRIAEQFLATVPDWYKPEKGYRAGPVDGPREWKLAKWTGSEWREIDTGIRSDNNYDFAELYIDGERDWRIIGASEVGPQPYNPGGEIAAWASHDAGETWVFEKRLTGASERNQNYPRQPLNVAPGFYAFWADGNGRKPSVSRLYFCNKALDVFEMPLSFEGDFATPVPYKPAKQSKEDPQ